MKNITLSSNVELLKDGDYRLDSFNNASLEIEVNSKSTIIVDKLLTDCALKIVVKEGASLTLSILSENPINLFDIKVIVKKNGQFDAYFADFSKDSINLKCAIDLVEEGASAIFHLASLAANKDNKIIDVSINHLSPRTYGKVDNYGVCKDNAKLTFLGTSFIANKSIKSKTQQNAKIMVFDEYSNAIAKPILKIDENDIEASHAAVVGKINDEHLFYLTSRGINETEAKELITFGYLKPILLGFNNQDLKEHISSLIEGRM